MARLSSSAFLTHGVTAEGAGGLVSARDFVYGAKVVRRHGRWAAAGTGHAEHWAGPCSRLVIGGQSVEGGGVAEGGARVRARHGPSCQLVEAGRGAGSRCRDTLYLQISTRTVSRYTWLIDCDYGGSLPLAIINIAMPVAQMRMVECIKRITPLTSNIK